MLWPYAILSPRLLENKHYNLWLLWLTPILYVPFSLTSGTTQRAPMLSLTINIVYYRVLLIKSTFMWCFHLMISFRCSVFYFKLRLILYKQCQTFLRGLVSRGHFWTISISLKWRALYKKNKIFNTKIFQFFYI